ncbi:MAG: orotidine 5'-phosphate decarboxylase [Candidatus Bathyarchaeota archaeon]|nr:orotidine 5'-phosphate decarboxylase [Candidatus Bathyarchaeota archaeon]
MYSRLIEALVYLSLALDFIDLDEALKIAEKCYRFFDILEAGTPLIKAEGSKRCIDTLKRFNLPIYLDLKTIDVGGLEALLAEDPVRYATVLALSDESTIRDFHEVCRSRGVYSVMDVIRCRFNRVDEVKVPVDYVALHLGVDERRIGGDIVSIVRLFRELYGDRRIAVAGGLNPESISSLMPLVREDDILAVGSYVARSDHPEESARKIRIAVDGYV